MTSRWCHGTLTGAPKQWAYWSIFRPDMPTPTITMRQSRQTPRLQFDAPSMGMECALRFPVSGLRPSTTESRLQHQAFVQRNSLQRGLQDCASRCRRALQEAMQLSLASGL
jgi:hypothetical protein